MPALSTTATELSRRNQLHTLEAEIRVGIEEFYRTGMKLKQIRDDGLYKADGFETWEKYCRERWEWSRDRATQLITAAEYREKLPTPTNGRQEAKKEWSERSVRELTRIPDKRDAARVAAKIVKHVESKPGTKLTGTLVRRFVDEDLGVDRAAKGLETKAKNDEGMSLREYINRTIGSLQGICDVLKKVPHDGWGVFTEENPGEWRRLAAACESLAEFSTVEQQIQDKRRSVARLRPPNACQMKFDPGDAGQRS